jgi:hypothetical protein
MVFQPQGTNTRDELFGAQSQELYEGDRAAVRVFPLDVTGALVLTNPVASFDQLIIARVEEPERERNQLSQSFDGHKLYAFGSDHRVYAISAALIDTRLGTAIPAPAGSESAAWTGRGHRDWVTFFEKYASLWRCAERRYLVQLTYGRRQVYGAFLESTPNINAQAPHRVDLLLSFYVTHTQPLEI